MACPSGVWFEMPVLSGGTVRLLQGEPAKPIATHPRRYNKSRLAGARVNLVEALEPSQAGAS